MMKKVLISAVAAAAMMSGAAQAQAITPSVAYGVEAEVTTICGVAASTGFTLFDVDFGDLTTTAAGTEVTVDPQGSIAYICNDPDGATRTISSTNNGVLIRTGSAGGAGNTISYQLQMNGGAGLGFTKGSVTTPNSVSQGGSAALRAGQNVNPQFFVNGVQSGPGPQGAFSTTVFSGAYTDTLTIALTAN